ncbi:MAG TPA: DUF924 family protein [Acetobacteraceae bacterium]|nr:DUF924 family protein [Acetobacteraceae bacterium]
MIAPDDLLDFWFAGDGTRYRTAWFKQDVAFDTECARFADALRTARGGGCDRWAETARGMLALIVLLDQLSRNLHRGSPESFAADTQARALAREAVTRGFDRALHPVERSFVYLPFEHSEDLTDQDESVRRFEVLRLALGDSTVEYAYRHRDLIRRFGRFPHRNAVLGRESTAEELRYLAEPGAGF